MKIAVEGCCHGELDKIYETIEYIEKKENIKVDLLLCCGDFQSVRNYSDLQCMAVPPQYQKLNTFYKYYSGEKKAPILTIFVGGNHEASNYLQELPYGGWVAPNILYLGYGGIIQVAGVRIGGLSGIYKGRDHNKGHFERVPYSEATKRSVYHVRNMEIFRLKQVTRPIDIFLSHDWPTGIYEHGNKEQLIRFKHYFKEEVEKRTLGSPVAEELLHKLKPTYWFAAHLHVKFAALVEHQPDADTDEKKQTRFLALDKCLPKRNFLQIVDVEHNSEKEIKVELDPEWLCILKSTNHLLSLRHISSYMPGPGSDERYDFSVTDEEINTLVSQDFGGVMLYPENFETTAPPIPKVDGMPKPKGSPEPPRLYVNPQTTLICQMLDISDPNAVFLGLSSKPLDVSANPGEIVLDDDIPDSSGYLIEQSFDTTGFQSPSLESSINPDEISLDDVADESGPDASPFRKLDADFSCDSLDTDSGMSPMRKGSLAELGREEHIGNTEPDANTEPVQTSTPDPSDEIKTPKTKKFKRRNQSLYCSSDKS